MDHYSRKPTTVAAFQWHDGDEPVYDLRGNLIDTRDGDYVLRDTVSGEVETIEEGWFQANYEKTETPNVIPGSDAEAALQQIPQSAPGTPSESPVLTPPSPSPWGSPPPAEPPTSPSAPTGVVPGQTP